jgi:hypothetical protein
VPTAALSTRADRHGRAGSGAHTQPRARGDRRAYSPKATGAAAGPSGAFVSSGRSPAPRIR